MGVLRTDLERALNEIASQEEGMRFQGLAVVLGKKRWPELIARQRKKDLGLDAYAPASLTPEKIGKGLAASITPTLKKISADAKTAKENFPDLKTLLFVTSAKVGNADRKKWEVEIKTNHGLELHIIEREEIITQMMMPENASLLSSFLHLNTETEPQVTELINRIRRATNTITQSWSAKIKGQPLIDLTAVRLDTNGAESADVLSLKQIDKALSESRRIVLEGPAGRGKTTMLIQLAQLARTAGTPLLVELPAWTSSRRGILEYIANRPAFQAEGLTAADLARVQRTEPFLFLLNGWNEIAESNSAQADDALRELERDFPSAGIIIATRTHHLTPPLPGASRLRLLRLQHMQREAYLTARLGAKGAKLLALIDADPSLDELTRTPFILSEVASLFEAGVEIPTTKIGILSEVLRLQEQRDEHRNALQSTPLFYQQTDFLKALATEMTCRGSVTLQDANCRAVVTAVAQELSERGQIEQVGALAVLGTLTAHHVLERLDYPQAAFQFEHQQLQEYYATLDVRTRLLDLQDDDHDAISRFTADYVNTPAWAEPLRMIAETIAEKTGNDQADRRNTCAGEKLVLKALDVDLVFAGELAHLCGTAVWNKVRAAVGKRLRAVYTIAGDSYRQYALAAMIATGADDFSDIIVPLLSGQDQQTRLSTYRLWTDINVSSLGANWREQVRGWHEEARADFVSELVHHRVGDEITAFAAEDNSIVVKKAAVSSLMWTGPNEAMSRILESMDTLTFEEVVCKNPEKIPTSLKTKTVASMWKFIDSTSDHPTRLRTALDLISLGESGLEGVVKNTMAALTSGDTRKLSSNYIQPALEYLRKTDPNWANEWVVVQIAEGVLFEPECWLPIVTDIPYCLVENYLQHLETGIFKNTSLEGMVAVIAARADVKLATRIFAKLCELQKKIETEPNQRHEFERNVANQLEVVFRRLPDNIAAAGLLASVNSGVLLDIKVSTNLLTKGAWPNEAPLRITDKDLKANLRTYLKGSVDLVLSQDDFNGEEKAKLALSIAQVGKSEDMVDLLTLIRADIERIRCGRVARKNGDRSPLGNGCCISYARWHIAAIMQIDPTSAEQVLIDLLPEPEYQLAVSSAMAHEFVPKSNSSFYRTFRYDLMWAARETRPPFTADDQRRVRFSAALNAEIKRLRKQNQDVNSAAGLKELAKTLAIIDGQGSAAAVLDVIEMHGQWDHYIRLDATERLLMAGIILPAATIFALLDSILERLEKWMPDQDRYLVRRILALCPFVDNPKTGISKIREVLDQQWLRGHEMRELITALGESRSNSAVDLLYELASDVETFNRCEENFIIAFGTLDSMRARELLLGFVDPDTRTLELTSHLHHEDVLVAQLTELAQRWPEATNRLQALCERDLPKVSRHVLSKVMERLGTPDALAANLSLIDDNNPLPVPQGVWDHLKGAFVEQRPYRQNSYVFTEHARASNELRVKLFRMANEDQKRRKAALMLLGRIEEWRLGHGRPTNEPRHPDLTSGRSWPPNTPDFP